MADRAGTLAPLVHQPDPDTTGFLARPLCHRLLARKLHRQLPARQLHHQLAAGRLYYQFPDRRLYHQLAARREGPLRHHFHHQLF